MTLLFSALEQVRHYDAEWTNTVVTSITFLSLLSPSLARCLWKNLRLTLPSVHARNSELWAECVWLSQQSGKSDFKAVDYFCLFLLQPQDCVGVIQGSGELMKHGSIGSGLGKSSMSFEVNRCQNTAQWFIILWGRHLPVGKDIMAIIISHSVETLAE